MIRSLRQVALNRRFSARSYWNRFREYKNTDSIEWAWMTTGQKLIHVLRSTGYFAFIVSGLGVMGLALNEVFKSTTESKLSWDIFEDAKNRIVDHEMVRSVFGLPMAMYAQDSSDARIRNSLGHSIQKETNGDRLWMSFVISGVNGKGYVTVEKFKKYGSDQYEYVTLSVHAPFAHQTIPIIDNRPAVSLQRIVNVGERMMNWMRSWYK